MATFDERAAAIIEACFPGATPAKRTGVIRDYVASKGLAGNANAEFVRDVRKDILDPVKQLRERVIVSKAATDAATKVSDELGLTVD